MASCTPSAFSASQLGERGRRVLHDHGLGDLEAQRARVEAASRAARAATSSTRPGCWSWRAERLTLIAERRDRRRGVLPLRAIWRQASSSTQRPSGTMRPVSSASGDEVRRGAAGRAAGAPSARAPRPRRCARSAGRRPAGSAGRTRRAPTALRRSISSSRRSLRGRVHALVEDLVARLALAPWRGTSRGRRRAGCPRAVVRRAVLSAMPMLTVTNTSRPSTMNGRCELGGEPLGDRGGRARRPSTSSSRIANSSPPSRATVSSGRRQAASRWPTADEELVADAVAEAVVDDLEAVEVEEEHRELLAAPLGRGSGRGRAGP